MDILQENKLKDFEKETLDARSEYTNSQDDGTAEHRINQYLIKQEIGRGSFGAVHLAVDQYGQEYVGILWPPHSSCIVDNYDCYSYLGFCFA